MCSLIILASVIVQSFLRTSEAASCLRYGRVTLTGTLVRQTYPGPPDYEDVTKGDEPRVIWVLLLETGICVVDPDARYPREHYQREIQLVVRSDQYTLYRSLLGKRIDVTGDLRRGGARDDKRLVIETEITARSHER
jgi:hypothetical protein